MTRLELVAKLTNEQGKPLVILPLWREAFTALDDPSIRELIISTPRQAGKSQLGAAMIASSLFTRPGSYSVLIAAGQTQAEAIFHRKLRRPIERFLREQGIPRREVIVTKRSIELLESGAKAEVLASDEGTSVGRSVDEDGVVVIDECRDVDDGIFAALLPSVTSGGKVVMIGTAGSPRGFFFEAIRNPSPETWLHWAHENTNPFAERKVVDFLARRLGALMPSAKRRELDNEFVDDGGTFLPAALVDAAIDDELGELPGSSAPTYSGHDLARRRDLCTRVDVIRTAPRRPEAADHLAVASIRAWDPKQSPTGEVDFAEVRADLAALPERFPRLDTVLIDEGSEGGAVLPFAKAHPALALRVRGFVATPESNMQLWSTLAARLHARTLSIPRHERLIAELKSLKQEQFAFGSRWRVIDSSRKFHRDLAVSLALAVFAAGEVGIAAADVAEPSDLDVVVGAGFHGKIPRAFAERQEAQHQERASGFGVFGGRPRGGFWR